MLMLLTIPTAAADTADYILHKYAPGNGGILTNVAPDGKWAVINLGTTASGMSCASELFNMETGAHFKVLYNNRELSFNSVSNVDAEGKVTIVGSFMSRPIAYRFDPLNPTAAGKMIVFTNKTNWASGSLTAVTPDGKYAVGHFTEYTGKEIVGAELNGSYWFTGIYADLENQVLLDTPGAPTGDRNGIDQHAMWFTGITPDGKHIYGAREWFMPSEGFTFIYDVDEKDYRGVGFKKEGNKMIPENGIQYTDFCIMSPNGRYIGGSVVKFVDVEGSDMPAEVSMPFRYDMQDGSMKIFDDKESSNIEVGCIDNNGTIFGNPDTGSPLRHFRILYQDKYWIPFSHLCQQVYGFNFSQKTGFEFSGTATSVSGDGKRMVAFSDPTGESFAFDFGTTVEDACSKFDLLSNYSVTPEPGSTFSKMTSIDINFGRSVQVIGKGSTHLHLYKKGKNGAADTKVRDGLSTTGESGGLHLKKGSSTVVTGTFRTTALEADEEYYVVLDAGAVSPLADEAMINKEIRIEYKGRNDEPVKMLSFTPEDGSSIDHIDATSSYLLLTYDCPVRLTEQNDAYLERIEEGGTRTRVATLTLAQGTNTETKNQILVYPTSTVYLYDGVEYRVVIAAGSICDYAGNESSYNTEWSINLTGTHVREIKNESTMFSDNFDDPNTSLSNWLMYEGDHFNPLSEMKEMGFDTDNTPWNFSTHDNAESPNYYATSHSLYAPSNTSDDWMMTPQLMIPEDGKAALEFDAQKRKKDKNDHLWIYVIPEDRNISYLNDNNMKVLKSEAILLDEITDLNAGTNETAEGNWKHYYYKLDEWAGKNIYIAFVNKNYKEDMVLVDNVKVQREILFNVGFKNEERVINKNSINIDGTFTIKTEEFASGAITLILKDENANEVSRISWPNIRGNNLVDRPIPMTFTNPLPLVVGRTNKFYIDVQFDGLDKDGKEFKNGDIYEGTIYDLAFETTKRVVLEEMTGTTCPNCPQGHIAIDVCERTYKDRFIPIGIHSYDGDDLGADFVNYTSFLDLNGAPSARINRSKTSPTDKGIYYPMYGKGNAVLYDMPEENLWYNVVARELAKPALCDITAQANLLNGGQNINFSADVKYALNTEQQISLFVVVLEDGIVSFQENNFANSDAAGLGEWGLGGTYGTYYAYPVTHNDVVRDVIGQTYAGTPGLLPQRFEAGKTYNVSASFPTPKKIEDLSKTKIVIMLIDRETGEVINAVCTRLIAETETQIQLSPLGYATFYDQYQDLRLDTGVKASVVRSCANGKLNYETIAVGGTANNVVPKDVAVMLQGEKNQLANCVLIGYASGPAFSGTNLLHGSNVKTTTKADGDCLFYKLTYGSQSTTSQNTFSWFWGAENGAAFEIEGHKAWLAVPRSHAGGAKGFSVEGSEISGIEDVFSDADTVNYYDLQGRRLKSPKQSGIYIRNNAKVIIK